jgi:hypothetical protein
MQKDNYKSAINLFLKNWKKFDYVEGAMLTGSYASKTQIKNSDIDIMIVLNNSINWWERGSRKVNNFIIEYIADPEYFWEESFQTEYQSRQKISIHMFATGKILFDKNGIVESLKEQAKLLFSKPFPPMNKRELEMAKYHLYDCQEKLNNQQSKPFEHYAMLYFLQLSKLISFYSSYLCISIPATAKVYNYFNDEDFRKKYKIQDFPDKSFVRMVNDCLSNYSSIKPIKKLTYYVLDKLGGFKYDAWVLKTDIKE